MAGFRRLHFLALALAAGCGGKSVHSDGVSVTPWAGASAAAGLPGVNAGTGGTAAGAFPSGGATAASQGGISTSAGDASANGGEGEAPGCAPDLVTQCSPGAGQICNVDYCQPGPAWPQGIDERGGGVICKYEPDAQGPDFACLDGEWCQYELYECRCGYGAGCQLGERCALCTGANCVAGEYDCVRDVACTADNLAQCAAEPGQNCAAGALACDDPSACATDSVGVTACPGAPSGCCAVNEWCFDGRECRCGVDPSCTDGDACALNSVGLYRCGGRLR